MLGAGSMQRMDCISEWAEQEALPVVALVFLSVFTNIFVCIPMKLYLELFLNLYLFDL